MATYTGVGFTNVAVYTTPSSGTLAPIYDDAGMTQPKGNPFTIFGNYTFYGAAGLYAIQGNFTQIIIPPAVAFASLPFAPVVGTLRTVTDANTAVWGATVAGGGANQILAFFNGSVWTVAAK